MKMPEAFEAIIRWHFVEKGKNTFCIEPEEVCPLVRCKDCTYGSKDDEGRWYCLDLGYPMGSDDGSGFCSEAERREDD